MNIVFVHSDYSWSGGSIHMAVIVAGGLAARGHRVTLLDFQKGHMSFFGVPERVDYISLACPDTVPGRILALRRELKKLKTQAVVAVDTGMALYILPAAAFTGCGTIVWEHSNFHNDWGTRLIPLLRRASRRFADAVVVLTERDAGNYASGTRGRARIECIHNQIERSGRHSCNTASRTVLAVGNLIPVKRFDLLLGAAAEVVRRHPDWHFDIWGQGDGRTVLELKRDELGLANSVFFRGTTKDLGAEYDTAGIYVMTSAMEGLPMVLLEAKAHGLPIVSFDIETGPSEIVRDGVNGYLVPDGDVPALAERICRLIETPELRQKFSAASQLDMEKFDPEQVMDKWETLLKKI